MVLLWAEKDREGVASGDLICLRSGNVYESVCGRVMYGKVGDGEVMSVAAAQKAEEAEIQENKVAQRQDLLDGGKGAKLVT